MGRAIHLITMIVFMEVAPFFKTLDQFSNVSLVLCKEPPACTQGRLNTDHEYCSDFLAMTLILSRLHLAAQYALILWHLRQYSKARTPLILTIFIQVIAACWYAMIAAISFSSTELQALSEDFIWIIAIVEITANIGISMVRSFKVISFKGTHLAERLTLLTLIILGEGKYSFQILGCCYILLGEVRRLPLFIWNSTRVLIC